MNGYLVTFFTQQSRRHQGRSLADWLLHLATELELGGATLMRAAEGVGPHHHLHSSYFFELSDQPVMVQMALSEEECARLFERVEIEQVKLFYVRTRAEFGVIGESRGDAERPT